MPLYLTRFSYTPETWARLIKMPVDRQAAAKQYIESVGGDRRRGSTELGPDHGAAYRRGDDGGPRTGAVHQVQGARQLVS